MSDELYLVSNYEVLQVSPCLGSGLRAIFKGFKDEPDFTTPVAAMAVCRVTRDWYRNGRKGARESVSRELCGVITYKNEGFAICEETSNFSGYLQPGEEL